MIQIDRFEGILSNFVSILVSESLFRIAFEIRVNFAVHTEK